MTKSKKKAKTISTRLRTKIVDQINQAIICLMLAIIDQRTQCSKSHKAFNGSSKFTTDYAKSHVKAYEITKNKLKKLVENHTSLKEAVGYIDCFDQCTCDTIGDAYDIISYLSSDMIFFDELEFCPNGFGI